MVHFVAGYANGFRQNLLPEANTKNRLARLLHHGLHGGYGILHGYKFKTFSIFLILLNIINTASSGDPVFGEDNIDNIAIAAGVFAVGTVMHLTHKKSHVLGKKYRMQIVQFSNAS